MPSAMGDDPAGQRRLTVGDLFCGAGGFSEGFAQAGFRIVWGVDNWGVAAETLKRNHPEANVLRADIMTLDPKEVGLSRVDVLIGSPPCVHFSPANRGGNGDRQAGMELVRRFLWFVDRLRPKYWVMENVPAVEPELRTAIHQGTLFPGRASVGSTYIQVLDASWFGTPQARRRLLFSNFPLPQLPIEGAASRALTLRQVLDALPGLDSPLDPRTTVKDPVYHGLHIRATQLRDHFEDDRWRLSLEERRRAKQQKRTHPVYGRMVYPDRLDTPARTITATRTGGSRSTIIVRWPPRGRRYRTLTTRECASVQGFPITYQFWGSNLRDRDRLVGNAVPPPLARAIARSILASEGLPMRSLPKLKPTGLLAPICPPIRRSTERHAPAYRRFRGVVPLAEWRHDRRVELDNDTRNVVRSKSPDRAGSVRWRARLYLGYAREYKCYQPNIDDCLELARNGLAAGPSGAQADSAYRTLLIETLRVCLNGFPTARELQSHWTGRTRGGAGPEWVVGEVRRLVDASFPRRRWDRVPVSNALGQRFLGRRLISRGKEAPRGLPLPLPIRTMAAATALVFACERLNHGTGRLETVLGSLLEPRGTGASSTGVLPQVGAPEGRLTPERVQGTSLGIR